MKNTETLELLKDIYEYGGAEKLERHMTRDCEYVSEYAGTHIKSRENVIKNMDKVYENVSRLSGTHIDYSYYCEVVDLKSILNTGVSMEQLDREFPFKVFEKGLLMYQSGSIDPAAIVLTGFTEDGLIKRIELTRNSRLFGFRFFDIDEYIENRENDRPSTVETINENNREEIFMKESFSLEIEYWEYGDKPLYVWDRADYYVRRYLGQMGYTVIRSHMLENAIAYSCTRNGYRYVIYMAAYRGERVHITENGIIEDLYNCSLSENSIPLFIAVRIIRKCSGQGYLYEMLTLDWKRTGPSFYRLTKVEGKVRLMYFPPKELEETEKKLIYAIDNGDEEMFDSVIKSDDAVLTDLPGSCVCYDRNIYKRLRTLRKAFGRIKMGYVSYNDYSVCIVPYFDEYGFLSATLDDVSGKFFSMFISPFEGGAIRTRGFIHTDISIEYDRERGFVYFDHVSGSKVNDRRG